MAVSRVAVIGAGPCGLAALKYLLAEKTFSFIQAYEQRDTVGGVWAYNTLTREDNEFAIPRTRPSKDADVPVQVADKSAPQFVSAVYDTLETNIPHTLMCFGDTPFPAGSNLFPPHQAVKKYLEEYGEEVKQHVSFSTQVLTIDRVQDGDEKHWEIETVDLKTRTQQKTRFDAVLVASGHYNDPYIPDIPGLAEFDKAYPGAISHSKFYRNPNDYAGKKVIVVGNSASGIDLSAQIQTVSKLPVIISERSPQVTGGDEQSGWSKQVPEIAELTPEGRRVRFANGHVEEDVDVVVFCTGYHYSFPFLRGLSPPIVTDGSYARNLYQHLVYINEPTLAIVGIPQRIIPFPFTETQVGWMARVWAGRAKLPAEEEMREWEAAKRREKEGQEKSFHVMPFPQDVDYINLLHGFSEKAETRPGLDNGGRGKIPPYWDAYKRWLRQQTPLIKAAARKLGEKRREIRTLEQLGFHYTEERN
ncbi:unnamed protein product [Clonostachys solani]|uniref:Thiol-specific monooxygenase n=1 Tax=Clonostachys solani TaxID=160281 RepID=A0A9N9Z7H8_9HYPO|nr:unnamed protein product [Clonostachys solani]